MPVDITVLIDTEPSRMHPRLCAERGQVSGAGLSMPTVYDPRRLALIALAMAAAVTYLWGPKTLAHFQRAT